MVLIVSSNTPDIDRKGRSSIFHFRGSLVESIEQYNKIYLEDSLLDAVRYNDTYVSRSKQVFFLTKEEIGILYNMTDRELLRDTRVSSILKNASSLQDYIVQKIVNKIDKQIDKMILEEDVDSIVRLMFKKLFYSKDISNEAIFILQSLQTPPKDSIVLKVDKYLTEATEAILEVFKSANTILLNAPTGVGKSHFSLLELPKHFKDIIIVSPLRMVTDEHTAKSEFIDFRKDELDFPYLAMTTDVLFNYSKEYPAEMKKRLDRCELIIFDEQHLIESSKGFRSKVEKAVKLIKSSNTKLLYLSGTPVYGDNAKSVVVKSSILNTIQYYNNPFSTLNELRESIQSNLSKGSVLFYGATKSKIDEVSRVFSLKNVCTITSSKMTYNGIEIKHIGEIPLEDKVLYISTSKATTGINISNLVSVYQYGTTYNTNTLVQLMARLRGNGNYYFIRAKFENNQVVNITNSAIGLIYYFKKIGLRTLDKDFNSKGFQKLISNRKILLADNTVDGFIKAYSDSLKLMVQFGFGKIESGFTYIPRNLTVDEVQKILLSSENPILKRDVDKTVVKFISGENIHYLNSIYNLSFDIQLQTGIPIYDKGLEIITDEDKAIKKEKRDTKKKTQLEFMINEFEYISPKKLQSVFSFKELQVLSTVEEINHDSIKSLLNVEDRVTALRCYLVPKKAVLDSILLLLSKNRIIYTTLKALDTKLAQLYINSSKRNKTPYIQFLRDLIDKGLLDDSLYEFKEVVKVDKTNIYNVVKLKKEYTEEYRQLITREDRLNYLRDKTTIQS